MSRAAHRKIRLFNYLATRESPHTISELSEGVLIAVSTVNKDLHDLQRLGVVEQFGASGRGHQTWRAVPGAQLPKET